MEMNSNHLLWTVFLADFQATYHLDPRIQRPDRIETVTRGYFERCNNSSSKSTKTNTSKPLQVKRRLGLSATGYSRYKMRMSKKIHFRVASFNGCRWYIMP